MMSSLCSSLETDGEEGKCELFFLKNVLSGGGNQFLHLVQRKIQNLYHFYTKLASMYRFENAGKPPEIKRLTYLIVRRRRKYMKSVKKQQIIHLIRHSEDVNLFLKSPNYRVQLSHT